MKRFAAITALLLALIPIHAAARPVISCTNRVFNFGMIDWTNELHRTFVIQNDGDSDLVIDKVRACCGASATLSRKVVPPGATTDLRVQLSLGGRKGKIQKFFSVKCNDPDYPLYTMTFRGQIRAGTAPTNTQNRGRFRPAQPAPPKLTLPKGRRVAIDFFYEKGCRDCNLIKQIMIPKMYDQYGGQYKLRNYDIGNTTNYLILVEYQEALNITDDESVCMVLDYQTVLNGFTAITEGLLPTMSELTEQHRSVDWQPPKPIVDGRPTLSTDKAAARAEKFSLPLVAVAGLFDGINPCAIGTLVFFMSLLAVAKIRGPHLLMVGIAFCTASFVTYTAIGFGLLRVFHAFKGFPVVQQSIESVMIAFLAIIAVLSFIDAIRYARSGKAADVTLQLPEGIKMRIHSILKSGLGARNLLVASFVTGVLVTALESVCTGQVYVPTLVVVITSSPTRARAIGLLLLYNIMFILPLILAFALTYQGMKTEKLVEWSRRNVVPSKILLALLFATLAVLLWKM